MMARLGSSRDLQPICVKSFVNRVHLVLQIGKIPSQIFFAFTPCGTKQGLCHFGHGALLENRPSAPVEKGLRYRFPIRCPATETIGLGLKHRTRGLRHPLVPVGKSNRYQRGCHADTSWQPHWYRLVFPTGTNAVGLSNRYQWHFLFFFKSSFVCYIYYCLFFYNC